MKRERAFLRPENLEGRIHVIRGQKVILDVDLAELYGVKTMALNQAVKRNRKRFPARFVFRLTAKEKREVITNCDYLAPLKYSPVTPLAFTEHGALMAATVLNSDRATQMSVHLIEAFRLRNLVSDRKELMRQLALLERKLVTHDESIRDIFLILEQMLSHPNDPEREMGFHTQMARPALPAKLARARSD
ncbi:MAG: ORF6N domain-containing protein [Verrucomicrobiota bacterium]|jgi:hypothetical protein